MHRLQELDRGTSAGRHRGGRIVIKGEDRQIQGRGRRAAAPTDEAVVAADIETAKRMLDEEERSAEAAIGTAEQAALDFTRHLLATIRAFLDTQGSKLPTDTPCQAVVLTLFTKIIRTTRAVLRLVATGYDIDAQTLLRSTLEALITLLYITKADCEERARLYVEYDHILAKHYLDKVDRWPEPFKDLDLTERRRTVVARFEAVKSNYPDPFFWASKLIRKGKLRRMAEDVGLGWYYDFIYWFGSNQTHSNVRSAQDYVDIGRDGTPSFKLGPSSREAGRDLSLAGDFLIRGLSCVVETFGLTDQRGLVESLAMRRRETFPDPAVTRALEAGPRRPSA